MALTRAQLLMGNTAQGTVLTGQVQGVRQGTPANGISIATDGVITVDGQTIVGVMKLGPSAASAAAAFNGYTWPTSAGTAYQQLTTDGTGVLSWMASAVPWTQKGQIVAATGVDAQATVNVGANTSILVSDSAASTNLVWSDAIQTAILLPIGNSVARPASPVAGNFRANTSLGRLEWYNGTTWESLFSAVPPAGYVPQTSAAGAAVMPWGNTAARPSPELRGYMRYNSTTLQMEYYQEQAPNGWYIIGANRDPQTYSEFTPRTSITGESIIPSGVTAQRSATPQDGMFRLNADLVPSPSPEIYGNSQWNQIAYVSNTVYPDLTISANVNMSGTYFCNNLVINSGVTITMTSSDIIIFCTGSATVSGSVAGSARIRGAQGAPMISFSNTIIAPGMNVGGGIANAKGSAYSLSTAFTGSGGSGGIAGPSAADTTGFATNSIVVIGSGGFGGGGFAVVARGPVVHNNTSTITCNGTDGDDGGTLGPFNTDVAGAGGGSGGCVVLQSLTSVVSTGNIFCNGGQGGDAYVFAGYSAQGGGGGGGGYIVLQAPVVTQGGTYTVSGGLGGAGSNSGIGAGGGGSFAGDGGNGSGTPLGDATAGVIAQQGSPFNPNFI